ncbi:unnamed protein product, partial [Musa textilis]
SDRGSSPPTWLARFLTPSPRSPRYAWPPRPLRRVSVEDPKGLYGLPRPEEEFSISLRPGRLVSVSRSPPRSFLVNVLSESHLPLVGNKAPDFEAEAVFDEVFIKIAECLTQLQSHSC